MFGESDSESPRVPSPWDSLTVEGTLPKLVPEAQEGNVEYKLQLLSPPRARFTRLVTQLKWRLLEGGGQAYYEVGVADSGLLVGLPRQQLEESLETLEMMAGEIGAFVTVVKEIEVPLELSTLAESRLERWDGGKSARGVMEVVATTSTTESGAELSNNNVADVEESISSSPLTPPTSLEEETDPIQVRTCTTPLLFDPVLAVFGDDVVHVAHGDSDLNIVASNLPTLFGLEISTVYKPRLMKKRATNIAPPSPVPYTKKKLKNGYPPSKPTDADSQDSLETHAKSTRVKAGRKDRRNKRRELKPDTLLTHVATCRSDASPTSSESAPHHTIPSFSIVAPDPSGLDSPHTAAVDPPTRDDAEISTSTSKEPRLIVEALVVWELSTDEAFLDFEGFSLQ